MKMSLKSTLGAISLFVWILPAYAMETAKDNPFCSLPANVHEKIATACNRCSCGCKHCCNSKRILDWKDIWNVQQTCRFMYHNFNPSHNDIVIDFSQNRQENEPIDAFIARFIMQLVKAAKYHHKTNKIVIMLNNNNLAQEFNGNSPLLSRLFLIINNMGLAGRISSLNLSNNGLREIPDSLLLLKNLVDLDLSGNHLSDEAVAKVCTISSLEELSLVGNNLNHLPNAFNMPKLETLFLGSNALPIEEFAKLDAFKATLQELGISGNNLTTIPNIVPNLENLEALTLDHNQIPDQEFAKLKPLQKLDALYIKNTAITRVPAVLWALPKLNDLDLSNNALSPAEIRKLCTLKNLKDLELDGVGLQTIPEEIAALSGLLYLSVSNNQLPQNEIEKICRVQSLTMLDISDNGLRALPAQLGNLHKLKTLNVSANFLDDDALALLLSVLPKNCELNLEDQVAAQ